MPGGVEAEKDILVLLEKAQKGDRIAREDLIAAHQSFIAGCVAKVVPRRGGIRDMDEYSIALLAFNEAVDGYDAGRGASFHGFARQVINRRLVDHYRVSRRFSPELPQAEPPEETVESDFTLPEDDVREEIERFATRLGEFGITLEDLVRETPRHRDSRRMAIGIARRVLEDPELRAGLERKKKLPFTLLLRQLVLNPKTIQRHRRYIIGVYVVLGGDFPLLREYVRGAEGGAESGR